MLDNMATTKMALSSGPRVFEAREHSQDSLIATPIAVRERESSTVVERVRPTKPSGCCSMERECAFAIRAVLFD